jgi:hypothetical protein
LSSSICAGAALAFAAAPADSFRPADNGAKNQDACGQGAAFVPGATKERRMSHKVLRMSLLCSTSFLDAGPQFA